MFSSLTRKRKTALFSNNGSQRYKSQETTIESQEQQQNLTKNSLPKETENI